MILDKYFLEQAPISSSRPVYSATSRCSDCVYSSSTLSPPSHFAMLSGRSVFEWCSSEKQC